MRIVMFLTLLFATPVIFSADVFLQTGLDPNGEVSLTAPNGTCSASNPHVGTAQIPVRGLDKTPIYPIHYESTPKGGFIAAALNVGSTYRINAPSGVKWVVTNYGTEAVLVNGQVLRVQETIVGEGSKSLAIQSR